MPQDRETGAAGNEFGHQNAPKIAEALGAKLTRPGSNEAAWNGKRAVIKSAGKQTSSVGVTYSMLKHLDIVIAAFQQSTGVFDVYMLPAVRFSALAVPSRSSDKVGIVTRAAFVAEGASIAAINVNS
jgi:hypothetical protein